MKTLKLALRFAHVIKMGIPPIKTKINPYTLTVGGLTTSYGVWFGSNKIFAE